MARVQFPTSLEVEFRGVEPASSFVNKQTGELVERPAALKLERELEDGDVMPLQISLREDVEVDFEADDLKRGEKLHLEGEVNCWAGKNGSGGFFLVPTSLRRAKAGVRPVPATATG